MTSYCRWILVIGISLLAGAARGQSPAGGEMLVNASELKGLQAPYDVACERSGVCIVIWDSGVFSSDDPPKFLGVRLGATTLASAGGVLKESIFAEDRYSISLSAVAVGQQFAIFWGASVIEGPDVNERPVYQLFDHDLQPASSVIVLPRPAEGLESVVDTARLSEGFVQLRVGSDILPPDSSGGAFLTFFDLAGRGLAPPVRVSPEAVGEQRAGGISVDPAGAVITAVYSQHFQDDEAPEADVFYRQFSQTGEPLTTAVRVNSFLANSQFSSSVATAPNGEFIVTWSSQEQDGSHSGIFGQRFTREGLFLGPEFQVNQETFSDQLRSKIAMDAAGNFVVVWDSYDPSSFGLFAWDIKARLYRADGTPVGPEIFVNRHLVLEQQGALVAFAPNGTFVAAWSSNAQVPPANENEHEVFARRFSASPADEPCVARIGKLSCDTGRTGGELEVQHGFGGPGSGLPFLGDMDGDGREDPCIYTEGIFRCDSDHEGGAAEVLIPFTVAGASLALAGDVDGDGRADPCLFGGGAFHCDTRHDGGVAETRIAFGQRGETPLLGDVDGDGRADACAFAGGLFRCDTAHNGGKAELFVRFGRRGDQPLLGDFDGDGRADPCVFRKGNLLCDTAHNGGAAEQMLTLGGAKDRVVLGNLDGL